jgi:hypothetical protein
VRALSVSNAGGIRPSLAENFVRRLALMTSLGDIRLARENPYHDRLEGDILTYTAAGKTGQQTISGVNHRLIEQKQLNFPVHGFVQIAGRRDKNTGPRRWRYLGMLQYLRHYPDTQLDADGKVRQVWLFELKIHTEPPVVPIALDTAVWQQVLLRSIPVVSNAGDDEVLTAIPAPGPVNLAQIEGIRSSLLAMEARRFETFIGDLLRHCGFRDVCVTRFTADGGVDVTAKASAGMWLIRDALFQVQAKRWLHSVGRKEVAELRGSLQSYARGAVITTSHFSKAALNEAAEPGKNPIVLINGYDLSLIVIEEEFALSR